MIITKDTKDLNPVVAYINNNVIKKYEKLDKHVDNLLSEITLLQNKLETANLLLTNLDDKSQSLLTKQEGLNDKYK